jgi:hypothetical protein
MCAIIGGKCRGRLRNRGSTPRWSPRSSHSTDSSAGRFWEPGVLARFLDEAAGRLARLHGDERAQPMLKAAPLVLVAYRGGYLPAVFELFPRRECLIATAIESPPHRYSVRLPLRWSDDSVAFLATGDEVTPGGFLTQAWIGDPPKTVMAKIPGFGRARSAPERPAKPIDTSPLIGQTRVI